MILKTTLLGKTYEFTGVKQVLAKANEEKTGDKLAGLAAESAQERVAAKVVLSALTLHDLRESPAVPYEEDEVTRIIQDDVNETAYRRIQNWTVSELREWILAETTTSQDIRRVSRPSYFIGTLSKSISRESASSPIATQTPPAPKSLHLFIIFVASSFKNKR